MYPTVVPAKLSSDVGDLKTLQPFNQEKMVNFPWRDPNCHCQPAIGIT